MSEKLMQSKMIDGLPSAQRDPMTALMWSVADLQRVMRVGKNTAYQLVNRADFPKLRVGNRILIPREAFLRWLDQQTKEVN